MAGIVIRQSFTVKSETFFRLSSYAMLAAALLALVVSGGVGGFVACAAAAVLVGSWKAEGGRWRLSERAGLLAVIVSLPLFYLDWKLQSALGWAADPARAGVNALAHFILFLSAVKLWQRKADRDWLFLYLISFFEVLLAAGLSLSPRFVATLALYSFCAVAAVVSFEVRRARRRVRESETRLLFTPRAGWLRRLRVSRNEPRPWAEARRLAAAALCLLVLVFALAMPIFFITPRLGHGAMARAEGGLTGLVGFADEVYLGEYGRLQQSSQVVMRVRVEDPRAARNQYLRWRGVGLDQFDGRSWRRSSGQKTFQRRNHGNFFQFGTTEDAARLTTQTFFVEPVDTPVLFAAARVVGVSGALPYVGEDTEGGLTTRDHPRERITYRAFSDTSAPPLEALRGDNGPYDQDAAARYLQLPESLDPRIPELARGLIVGTGADNRYDAARVVEEYFRQNFKYSLDVRGEGADPLADFMFRVRAGHCEYYSTAMAVMLRSQRIAARVVNGFQMGEYNDAADVFTVRQSDAHSWVEVYFPETNAWVAFDPTPVAGRPFGENGRGARGVLGKYAEALEMFWIQYVVDYDRQEQQQLATRFRDRVGDLQRGGFRLVEDVIAAGSGWWSGTPTIGGAVARPTLVGAASLAGAVGFALVVVARRRGFRFRAVVNSLRGAGRQRQSPVAFYERMTRALAARGLRRAPEQTPLEFASTLDAPEAVLITRAYNRVRFGSRQLTRAEAARVEEWLRKIEKP
jgi:protein-glutamine gamma-glutamyltransferase